MQNPYAPPETSTRALDRGEEVQKVSKPIIPALIGIFTYGSSSPYALVLCIEHYLSPKLRPIPWTTHLAAVLATIGSIIWFWFNIVISGEVLSLFRSDQPSMYLSIGLSVWFATIVFFIWTVWRVVQFRRQIQEERHAHGRWS